MKVKVDTSEEKVAYTYAIKCLSRKSYTTFELKSKLKDRGYNGQIIERTLERVSIYLDDEDLLRRYILEYLRQGKGPGLILAKIQSRTDVPREQLKEWIVDICSEEKLVEQAVLVVKKKFKTLDAATRNKAYRFLYSRGFTGATIEEALKGVL